MARNQARIILNSPYEEPSPTQSTAEKKRLVKNRTVNSSIKKFLLCQDTKPKSLKKSHSLFRQKNNCLADSAATLLLQLVVYP